LSIYGINASTGVLDIRNPWGVEAGQYWDTTFAISLSTLLADGDTISVADPPATPVTIASNGVTKLVEVANQFALDPAGGGSGPFLMYEGSPFTAGEFGPWTPIGAVETASGYEVALKEIGTDGYTIWTTDSNGNYTGNTVGLLSGESYTLEEAEVTFGEDLNGDGTIGPPTTAASAGLSSRSYITKAIGSGSEMIDVHGSTGTFADSASLYNDTVIRFSEVQGARPYFAINTVAEAPAHVRVNQGSDTLITLSDHLTKGLGRHIDGGFFS
jgi:hypothetical protein